MRAKSQRLRAMSARDLTHGDRHWPPIPVVERLVSTAFGPTTTIVGATDAAQGRGIFSEVIRVELDGTSAPRTVIAKLPAPGPNGEAAITTGAVAREALAYAGLLANAPVRSPHLFAAETDEASTSFLFEDLGERRAIDQLDGLDETDTLAVVRSIGRFHSWNPEPKPDVRACTPALFSPDALEAGLGVLGPRWGLGAEQMATFRALVDRRQELIDEFAQLPSVLCHGDVRADNLVFDPDGVPVLFDWQQLAWQTGGADIAWLLATSLDPEIRRKIHTDVRRVYAEVTQTSLDTAEASIMMGYLLPGLAVLMLAQRPSTDERTNAFIQTSVERISKAIEEEGPG